MSSRDSSTFFHTSFPRISSPSPSATTTTTSSSSKRQRPSSAMPLQSFIASRASRPRQRSPWVPSSAQPQQAATRVDSPSPGSDDYLSSEADFNRDDEREMLRDDRTSSVNGTGHLFDSHGTLSLSDTESTISVKQRRQQLEAYKLPVPQIGESGPAAQRGKRERGNSVESEIIELDEKPNVFKDRKGGFEPIKGNQQGEDEEGLYDEQQYEDIGEVPGGYDFSSDNSYGYDGDDRYEHGLNIKREQGLEGADNSHDRAFFDQEEYTEKAEDDTLQARAVLSPGLWDETQTLSSRGWIDQTMGNDAFAAAEPPKPSHAGRKGKEVRIQETSMQPSPKNSQSNYALLPAIGADEIAAQASRNGRQVLPYRSGNRRDPQEDPPLLASTSSSREKESDTAPETMKKPFATAKQQPLRLSRVNPLQKSQLSKLPAQQARHDPDRTIRPIDRHPSGIEVGQQMRPPTPNSPNEQSESKSTTPYLSDDELKAISSYSALLCQLQHLHDSSRSAPPNLETELKTLLSYAYPQRDTEKPRRFFDALTDDAYDEAGDIIASKKAELEQQMKEATRKRRKVARDSVESIRNVAEERVKRLKDLEERRKQLRGGVGKLLMEGGFDLPQGV